jgi:tryptophan 6-halogenase
LPDRETPALGHKPESLKVADEMFDEIRQRQQRLLEELPSVHQQLRKA